MKNTQAPTEHRSKTTIVRSFSAVAALTLLITTSCTTSQQVEYSPTSTQRQVLPQPAQTAASSDWQLVSEQPPTYFPTGLDKDAETDFRAGDWVRAGENGTQWFIPKYGVGDRSAQQLRRQAMAMTTDGQKRDLALGRAMDGAGELIGAPLRTAADVYSFLAGGEGPAEIITEMDHR